MNWHLGEPRPAILVLPPGAASLDEAEDAIALWEYYTGKVLDPTQRLTVQVMMAQTADSRWAAATTGREMPRQNGKGDEVEVVELWGLVKRAEAIMHTVHDAVLLATQTQQRLLGVIEGHADLRRKKLRAWQGTGQQMIEMRNGGIIWYRTRTGGGGRGVDQVDRLVVDEAQHAQEEHLSAVSPPLLAADDPQMNVLGTAGLDGRSAWWWSQRIRALSPNPGSFGYVGHTAEQVTVDSEGKVVQPLVDIEDRTLWPKVNPALHAGRAPLSFFEEQLRRLGPRAFAQEHLGVWGLPPFGSGASLIDPARWAACLDRSHKPTGPLRYALDVSPDARSCAVAVSDGTHHEIVHYGQGIDWVVGICDTHRGVLGAGIVLDPAGPAVELIAPLEAKGIAVQTLSTADAKAACGRFLTAVTEGTLRHIGNKPELDLAVSNADRREVGDGGWLWSRVRSSVDICPLVAATWAGWAAGATRPQPEAGFVSLADFLDEE